MQISKQTAKNYAQALSESLSGDITLHETFLNEIKIINESFNQVKNIWEVFNNPSISTDEKKELIKKIFQGKINAKLLNFLFLLIDKKRFNLLPEIQNQFTKIVNKLKNTVIAEVQTASEIDPVMLEKLKQRLESIFTKNEKVTIETKVNPELIGGLLVKVEDLIYDGSIKGRLDDLKRKIEC